MIDPIRILDEACQSMITSDPESCERLLERFRKRVTRDALDPAVRADCARQLERLKGLATAATEGLDASRDWLRELSAVLGGLDVYDRAGKQRVSTELPAQARRF